MKNIILILSLLSLGVSKAQVVVGYLPLNSTKSATIGSVRTNSLVVTAPTISVNNKTLTAGNTGTVAVLSDVYFTIPLSAGAFNPADATPYYFGNLSSLAMSGNRYFRVNVPYACTLIGYDFQVFSNGVIGSSESATLSVVVNNSSTITLNSSVSYTNNNTPAAVNGFFSLSGTGLTTSLSAGDYLFGQLTTPTWGTNPTSIVHSITLYFKRN